jgi:hypothetical protein
VGCVVERGLLIALSNSVEGRDDEFNKWYNEVHVPDMLTVEGVLNCTRARFSDVKFLPNSRFEGYSYITLYDVEANDDEGFERISEALRQAFFGGASIETDKVISAGTTNEQMPISDALDLTTVKDTFATVLTRWN